MTVGEALSAAGIDSREARLLLAAAAGFSEATVAAFPERPLPRDVEERFFGYAARRRAREPVAYILGRKEFYGLELAVNRAVLIPRPETELLVDVALGLRFRTVLDLGTGSGAVALALKLKRPHATVVAVEASAAALAVAKRNAAKHGLDIEFRHGRWFEPIVSERFDLIVSNPPYVADGDPHLTDLAFEPREALVAGPDGFDALRAIVRGAPPHLSAGGVLLLEHGCGQDAAVRSLLQDAGFDHIDTWLDLAGIPRVTGGAVK